MLSSKPQFAFKFLTKEFSALPGVLLDIAIAFGGDYSQL